MIDRLARLGAADVWKNDINPGQAAALSYLAQANRFSRAPSHVADYLGSTRGTISQTLKALARKGLVTEAEGADRRSIRYDMTPSGRELVRSADAISTALDGLSEPDIASLNAVLAEVLREMLAAQNGRSFGICRSCAHHRPDGAGGWCSLLKVELDRIETEQLCHEHTSVAA